MCICNKSPVYTPSIDTSEQYFQNTPRIPVLTTESKATRHLRNIAASCLYYSRSHLPVLWLCVCYPSFLILNIVTRLILLKLKLGYSTLLFKCPDDFHFYWEFKPKSLQLNGYAILCNLASDLIPTSLTPTFLL